MSSCPVLWYSIWVCPSLLAGANKIDCHLNSSDLNSIYHYSQAHPGMDVLWYGNSKLFVCYQFIREYSVWWWMCFIEDITRWEWYNIFSFELKHFLSFVKLRIPQNLPLLFLAILIIALSGILEGFIFVMKKIFRYLFFNSIF